MRYILYVIVFLMSYSSIGQTPDSFLLEITSDISCGDAFSTSITEGISVVEVRDISNTIITKDCSGIYYQGAKWKYSQRPSTVTLSYSCYWEYYPGSDGLYKEGWIDRLETITIPSNATSETYSQNGLSVKFTAYSSLEQVIGNADCSFTLKANANVDMLENVWGLDHTLQYETDTTPWNDLPLQYQNNSSITLTIDDLGISPGAVRFRLLSCEGLYDGGTKSSNIVSYTAVTCSPQLLNFTSTDSQCSYSQDGSFSMVLDRDLDNKELVVTLDTESVAGSNNFDIPMGQEATSTLNDNGDGTYSYEWPNPIYSGNYKVKYQSHPIGDADAPWDSLELSPAFAIGSPDVLTLGGIANNVSCYGATTGSVTLSAGGGTPTYSYSKDGTNYQASATFAGLSAGNHTFHVKDTNTCEATTSVLVAQPTNALTLTQNFKLDVKCYGESTGLVVLSANGGTPTYTYSKDGSTYQSSATFAGLSEGSYTFHVKDNNACEKTIGIVVNQPVSPLTLAEGSKTGVLCYGGSTGSITLNAAGGTPTYTYSKDGTFYQNSATFAGLSVGSYTFYVKDSNNCETPLNSTITEPTQTLAFLQVSKTDVVCHGGSTGSITLNVEGGTPTYTYSKDGTNYQASATFSGLLAGNYTFYVKDSNNCEAIQSSTLSEPATALTFAQGAKIDINCYGDNTGSVTLNAAGGVPGYTYSKDGSTYQNSPAFSGLLAGTYTFYVKDAIGCESTQNSTINQPPSALILAEESNTTILCYGDPTGSVTLSANGGTPTYTYSKDGSTYQNSPTFSNLLAGNYIFYVKDANTCITPLNSIVSQPTNPLAINLNNKTEVLCYGENTGAIDITVVGGTGSYSYIWSNGVTTQDVSTLFLGDYTVTVTDDNGCSATNTFNISQPPLYDVTSVSIIRPSNTNSEGRISIEITGGVSPFTYQWFNASGVLVGETLNSGLTSNTITNLQEGNYRLVITDNIGCVHQETYSLADPGELIVDIEQVKEITCFGSSNGQLQVISIGGLGGNEYTWYDATSNSEIGNDSEFLVGIPAGSYYVVAKNVEGIQEQSAVFELTQPEDLTAVLETVYTSCGTGNDWTINAAVQGGTLPYSFSWSTGDSTSSITAVQPGNYMVIIRDVNGCQIIKNYRIEVPEILNVVGTTTQVPCLNSCEGAIDLNITGGVGPYSIDWNFGATTANVTNLCPGSYSVSVTDQKGCETIRNFVIRNPAPIVVNLGDDKTLCNDQFHELDITIAATGVLGATYHWTSSNGFSSNSPMVSLTEAGIYTATVTTPLGCVGTDTIEIFESNLDINSEFLITTQAFASEDIILINTSNPVSTDVEWVLPVGAKVIEETTKTITLRFSESGAYEVTLRSFQGECYQDYKKPIIVEEARYIENVEEDEVPFIIDFNNYPNPADGQFQVSIKLKEKGSISLRLFSLVSNTPIDDKQLNNNSEYKVSYNVNVPTGIYFLLLETVKGSEIRKIIIK